MADKVFIVNLEELEQKGIPPYQLFHMPIPDLEKISEKVMKPEQAISALQLPIDVQEYKSNLYQYVYREIGDEEIHVKMGIDDWQEVIVNKDLQIHIKTNNEGYSVDLYAWNENTPDDERDYDNEFLGGCYAFYADVDEARKVDEDEDE